MLDKAKNRDQGNSGELLSSDPREWSDVETLANMQLYVETQCENPDEAFYEDERTGRYLSMNQMVNLAAREYEGMPTEESTSGEVLAIWRENRAASLGLKPTEDDELGVKA